MRKIFMPSSLEDLFSVMSDNPESSVMAGGTDLLVRLRNISNTRHDRKKTNVVLLEKIPDLKGIKLENDRLVIGSGVTFSEITESRKIKEHAPLLAKAASVIGGPAIRNMATIGGNIVTASPAGDSLPPLYIMNAELEIVSADKTETVRIDKFIKGPSKTVLGNGEIIKSIMIPLIKGKYRGGFEKTGRRKALAVAVASFAGILVFSEDGRVKEARFAWGSVAPTVFRSDEAESIIKGSFLEPEAVAKAVSIVSGSVSPIDDIRASADYRRKVSGNLLVRFLEKSRIDLKKQDI